MSNTTTADLSALLGSAGLTPEATQSMQLTVDTLGPAIQAGLGTISLDDITTAEVLLVTFVIDDSGSISYANNIQLVCTGHNLVLDALQASKQSAEVLTSCRFLNYGAFYPYVTIPGATRLDTSNFLPRGATPLFDQVAIALTGVATKMAEFENGGVSARAVTVIVSDGGNNSSTTHRHPKSIKSIVDGLLATEQHIVAGVGVDDGHTDFHQVFGDMGIRPEWILTPGNTPSEIRRAFQVVSQSAVRASQAAGAAFSTVAMGGFGQP
ncbi:MAG: hypothetical protein JWN38_770 [Candidatus Saccharibacteria bacterium]|nr:hypothetical protein [Candidatus Saccharibacteria bacterium]